MTNTPSDEERARQLLVRFKADLLELAQRGDYGDYGFVVIAGLLDVAEGLARRTVRAHPTALPDFLERLDALRTHVADVGQRAATVAVPPTIPNRKRLH